MQTITQSVVESYTKLVYKYIKQDVEAENNHTAKGKQSDMYIELKDINKTFGNYKASDHVEFGIEKGKLVALLEPSGSGKTTILRMIAGLEHQDSGDIYIDGTCVNELLVRERGIGFVFQNYALFPYMTVFDNVAYGLKVRKEDKKVIEKRVKELLVNVNGILLKTISHCF